MTNRHVQILIKLRTVGDTLYMFRLWNKCHHYNFDVKSLLSKLHFTSIILFYFFNQNVKMCSFFLHRDDFGSFLKFMEHLSYQCDRLLGDKELMTFLREEHYDIAILDAFNPCSFIVARKLGTSAAQPRTSASCHRCIVMTCH